ncbi:c-type cytochrome [Variovorax saccharolyticus]|uniref:c-type cytochrome n=1 Tax=Variovorax saccharolyticus TaxID=3053516 RepID=UPI0025757B69|nr:c-type cytochrome [Variovorax sp. J22R187]MDM0021397.1 c-type cytochrome [Variovorax sp. J22R187]
MSRSRTPAARDHRFAVWIGTTAALLVAAVAAGFVWLPARQAEGAGGPALWDVICSAIGLPVRHPQAAVEAGVSASNVAWTAATRQLLSEGKAARGAVLAAATCNNCHGANGVGTDAIFPNLAGQSQAAIYKQLEDFRSGRRDAAVMGGYVSGLSPQDVRDLAAHYASLPDPFAGAGGGAGTSADAVARRLVEVGDPLRGIAACAACHGPLAFTPGAPGLRGQQRAYLEVQLQALASGRRHNDISAQMRSVARQLTGQEISALAAYYASPGVKGDR